MSTYFSKQESDYITILCGEFDDSYSPLTRSEFWKLFHKYGDSVQALVDSGEERVEELLRRSGSVTFSLEKLEQMGIRPVAFREEGFPERLTRLKDFCPPLLYTCGDTNLRLRRHTGYVGSRDIGEEDIRWTESMVRKNVKDGFDIVTGGARGVDSVSLQCALAAGGNAVLFLPDNFKEKLKDRDILQGVMDRRILLYSHVSPFAKKNRHSFVAAAMERNKFIYAQSVATVVVRSDLGKGGTWSGATETLKHQWAVVFVWDNPAYPGNQKLIELGGRALSDEGTTDSGRAGAEQTGADSSEAKDAGVQLSLFDMKDFK